jgi:hypothetical protein
MTARHHCYEVCTYVMRATMPTAVRNAGYGDAQVDIEIICGAPLFNDGRWAGFTCPHGNDYWMRPTDAQREQWHRDGVA